MERMKVIQGDSLKILPTLESKSVDFTFTSPPYNRKRNDKYEHYDDTEVDYYGLLKTSIEECLRITRGHVIFNIQKNYYNKNDVFRLLGEFAERIVELIIWEKSNPMPAAGFAITNAYEFFIVFGDKPLKSNTTYTKNHLTTAVHSAMPKEHKAVMKPEVASWFIEKFTQPGDLILDPFLGIGTTGIEAEKLGRRCIGIELCQEYASLIPHPPENTPPTNLE